MARRTGSSSTKPKSGPARSKRREATDRARLLEFLLGSPDVVIDNPTMAKVLGARRGDSWTRRLRELREPRFGGYTVLSHFDRKGMTKGQYFFPKQERHAAVFTPRISGRVRAEVLFRDEYTCQSCGLSRGETYDNGSSVKLQVAHNVADSHGGKPDVDNCFTQCHRCNVGESNVGPDRPLASKVLAQVKRLPDHQRRQVYEYLRLVFKE